jgi:hypothetical protein
MFVILCALAAVFAQGSFAQERPRPVRTVAIPKPTPAETDLEKAHAEFRRTIVSAMQEAAAKAGIKIRTKDLVAIPLLISNVQQGIQAAFLQQVETVRKEFELLQTLPEEKLIEYLVPEEEVESEFQRLFTITQEGAQMKRMQGIAYKPAIPEKGQEEDPPIKRLTGYDIKPEDVREGQITPEGERRIKEHLRKRIATERLDAVKEVYRRGVPYILVDHGKLNVKLAFYTTPQESSQTKERSPKPTAEFSRSVRPEAISMKIDVQVVNERNVEVLGREAGAFGEIEISFKVDLR